MRRSKQEPIPDTGQKGYRQPDEPRDGRPRIFNAPFWASPQLEATYLNAVERNPIQYDEGRMSYFVRIAGIAEAEWAKLQAWKPGP